MELEVSDVYSNDTVPYQTWWLVLLSVNRLDIEKVGLGLKEMSFYNFYRKSMNWKKHDRKRNIPTTAWMKNRKASNNEMINYLKKNLYTKRSEFIQTKSFFF